MYVFFPYPQNISYFIFLFSVFIWVVYGWIFATKINIFGILQRGLIIPSKIFSAPGYDNTNK
ncbi:MAG TPA: hypothetical protein DDZ04_09445 [Parabacteroides sp.]|nr:hypothetical protein [Parabacteroides sp.]